MAPHEILLVQNSLRQVVPVADQAAALFYARLFELDPSLRPLFRGDMHEQGRKLMSFLGTAVSSLDRLEEILPKVRQLGVRHASYGVRFNHYATIGSALLWTLEKALGPAFDPDVRSAWNTVYATLAGTMICAAKAA
jgi:hemoglobin-like flavoprotein